MMRYEMIRKYFMRKCVPLVMFHPNTKIKKQMNSFSIHHLCQDYFFSIQQPLIDIILKAANPEMIFLLGTSLNRRGNESIFHQPAPDSLHVSNCFLLILIKDRNNKELYEWQDKIENDCKALMPVTTIVLQHTTFEEWLKQGHFFAASVLQSAVLIYNSGNFGFPDYKPASAAITKPSEKHLLEGLTKAKEFLAGSELFRVRKQHAMAAFMLHQSAEQALHTLLKAGTGYHANTHSIDKLLRYASLVSYQLPDIFPQKTEEEKRLFNLLQKAYTDSRYKEDYKISTDDLLCITEKVRRILEILSGLDKNLISSTALTTAL